MRFDRTKGNDRALAIAVGSIVFLLALSWLPYKVPVARVYSESYVVGYNNRVGALLTALGAVLLAIFGPSLAPQFSPGKPLASSTLKKTLAISGALSGALYLLTRKLDGVVESIYLIDRIKLLLEGKVPYKDFEYAYGALFLYGPAWISRGLHIDVGNAYGLVWISLTLLGTYLLYKTILWVDVPAGRQRSIFLFFWIFSVLNLFSFGITYTLFRYVLPCFFALLVYRRLAPAAKPCSQPAVLLWPVPMYALLLLISPELGIAFAVGMTAFLLCFGHLKLRTNLAAFVVGLALMGAVTYAAERCGLFSTLAAFSKGGFNLPLMPAPSLLLLFLWIGLAACYTGQRLRAKQPDALVVLIAVSSCSLAAALGRCDPLHTILNPLGVSLAGCFLLTGLPALRRVLWPATWVVYVLLFSVTLFNDLSVQIEKAALPALLTMRPARLGARVDGWVLARLSRALGPAAAATKFQLMKAAGMSAESLDVPAIFHLPAGTVFQAPFGFAPGRFGTYHASSIDEGYYFENENLLTPEAVARKVSEMRAHPGRPLLLLPDRENACTVKARTATFQIGPPFYYPYMVRPVHENDVTEPLCAFIRGNYHLAQIGSPSNFGYGLWLRN